MGQVPLGFADAVVFAVVFGLFCLSLSFSRFRSQGAWVHGTWYWTAVQGRPNGVGREANRKDTTGTNVC